MFVQDRAAMSEKERGLKKEREIKRSGASEEGGKLGPGKRGQ